MNSQEEKTAPLLRQSQKGVGLGVKVPSHLTLNGDAASRHGIHIVPHCDLGKYIACCNPYDLFSRPVVG